MLLQFYDTLYDFVESFIVSFDTSFLRYSSAVFRVFWHVFWSWWWCSQSFLLILCNFYCDSCQIHALLLFHVSRVHHTATLDPVSKKIFLWVSVSVWGHNLRREVWLLLALSNNIGGYWTFAVGLLQVYWTAVLLDLGKPGLINVDLICSKAIYISVLVLKHFFIVLQT